MKKESGFTILEIIVATAIISFIIPSLFSLLFFGFQIQIKSRLINQVKKEGDFTMNSIITNIKRNARGTNKACSNTSQSNMTSKSILFVNRYDPSILFTYTSNLSDGNYNIASSSSHLGTETSNILTSSDVNIENFLLRCMNTTSNAYPIISVSFIISSRINPSISLTYRNKVLLRNR